jgi:hypothetical protein
MAYFSRLISLSLYTSYIFDLHSRLARVCIGPGDLVSFDLMLGPSLLQIRQTDSNQNSIKHDSLRIQHCWVLLQVLIDNFPKLHQSF